MCVCAQTSAQGPVPSAEIMRSLRTSVSSLPRRLTCVHVLQVWSPSQALGQDPRAEKVLDRRRRLRNV